MAVRSYGGIWGCGDLLQMLAGFCHFGMSDKGWEGDSPVCDGFSRKLTRNDDLGSCESHRRNVDFLRPTFATDSPTFRRLGDVSFLPFNDQLRFTI